MSGTRSFSYDLLDSHQGLLYPQHHGSFAATRVVLSVLQDARSCAEVAHAVLGMRSLKDGVTLWRPVRQVLPAVRCCGLLAGACKADFARYIFWFLPQVAADICRPCWVLCFLFTQEQDDDLRFERTAACGWPR